MALAYLRHNSISVPAEPTATTPAEEPPVRKKLPKGKFSLLLSSNVIVWVIFAVSLLDIKGFSMSRVPIPRIPQKLTVSGIVYNETAPSAIIAKQVYGVGDRVEGYTITRITRTEVEFEKNGKKLIRKTR